MMGVSAVRELVGYDASLISGEEPELRVRLRHRVWRTLRIDAETTLQDLAMTRFGHWWRRSVRAGHAFPEGAAPHGAAPERHWVRESRSTWIWGFAVPIVAIALDWLTHGVSVAFALGGML